MIERPAHSSSPFRMEDASALVVNDDWEVLRRVRVALRSEKVLVDVAETVDEAVARMGRQRYDVFLIDFDLPNGSCLDLLDRIKDAAPDSLRIVLTDSPVSDELVSSQVGGVCTVLNTLRSGDIVEAVRQGLTGRARGKAVKVAVVIPSYNEEDLILDTLSSVPGFVDRVYAVDDGSMDGTLGQILSFAKGDPRVVCVHHALNRGVGAAIVSGYRRALEDGMDVAVVMAGDNQMDPSYMRDLVDPIVDGRADYVKANRLMSPEYRRGMGRWRFFGNAILTFLTKIASGYWQMMDPQNGYTAISRNALERLDLDSIYPWYGYCNDLLVKLNVFGLRVVDVMVPARYGREKSGIKYSKYIVKVSYMLLRNFFWRLKTKYVLLSFHPLVLFYILGIIITPLGFFGGLYSLYYKFVMGRDLFIRGVLSLLLFIVGIQFLFFAMLFDMQNDSYRRDEDKRR